MTRSSPRHPPDRPGPTLLGLLEEEVGELSMLLERYFVPSARAEVVRGSLAYEIRSHLARLDAVEESLIPALASQGGQAAALAHQLDGTVVPRRRLMDRLDGLTAGVSPRDMHVGGGSQLDEVVQDLHGLLEGHLQQVALEVLPALRALPYDQLARLPDDAGEIARLAMTRPKPTDPLARGHSRPLRRLLAGYQRLRDHGGAHRGAPVTAVQEAPRQPTGPAGWTQSRTQQLGSEAEPSAD